MLRPPLLRMGRGRLLAERLEEAIVEEVGGLQETGDEEAGDVKQVLKQHSDKVLHSLARRGPRRIGRPEPRRAAGGVGAQPGGARDGASTTMLPVRCCGARVEGRGNLGAPRRALC